MHRIKILKKIYSLVKRNKLGELLVVSGTITPLELKHALNLQSNIPKPLGEIFLEQDFITEKDLSSLLFRQKLLRTLAAILLCFSACMSPIRQLRAANNHIHFSLASMSASATRFDDLNIYPALFGANEKKSGSLRAFTKWLNMFERFEKELKDDDSQRILHSLKIRLSAYHSESLFEMAKHVDSMMNKEKYIVDKKNWNQSDYWATPVEFMEHGGDCEDFAIAKYVALRALGIPDSRLRVAIVQDLKKNMPHAVLIVYTEKGPYVLDNQSDIMRSANTIKHYKPIYSINRHAWWLHTSPDSASNSIVASAE